MDFQLRCGTCKEEISFEKLKRDNLSKRYHEATLVSCQSCNSIYYYCSLYDKKTLIQQSYKKLVLKSRVCRHDAMYHKNDT